MSINERVIENVIYRRLAPFLLILALAVAIVAAVGTYANGQAIARSNADQIKSNQDNAVTSCENANESRDASRTLWGYVVDLSLAGKKDPTAAEVAYFGEFRAWVNEVYQPHDCQHLDKKYKIPPPPTIPAPQSAN